MPIGINGSGTVTGVSVGGLPDGIVDTDMLAANAVTAAKTTVPGITGFDQYYLTSSHSSNGDITSNFSRTATAGTAVPLGSGMTESSGIFSFPNTGIWIVLFNIRFQIDGTDNVDCILNVTTNNSDYTGVTHAVGGLNGSGSKETSATSMYFLDVTDVSQVKVKFSASSISGGSNISGTATPITNFNFIRIGDT